MGVFALYFEFSWLYILIRWWCWWLLLLLFLWLWIYCLGFFFLFSFIITYEYLNKVMMDIVVIFKYYDCEKYSFDVVFMFWFSFIICLVSLYLCLFLCQCTEGTLGWLGLNANVFFVSLLIMYCNFYISVLSNSFIVTLSNNWLVCKHVNLT